MNHEVIADEEQLRQFIAWLPDLEKNEKYYVCLFARKKYSPDSGLTNDKTQLKRFTSNKERLIEKIRQLEIPRGYWKLKGDIVAPQEALALYITVNPRCMKSATEMMGKKCWDLIKSDNYNLHAEAMSCIQKSKSRTYYVDFDIDDKTIEMDTDWLDQEIGANSYSIIETRGGFHLLVKPELASDYRKQHHNNRNWYQQIQNKYPVDQSGDQLLPVVGAFQGGFVPSFVKR